ncbi:MAG: HlyD family efflux transporter periplasmic adaptor subunit [Gemmatimonadaceae bacterium]
MDIKRDPPKKTRRNVIIGVSIAAVAILTFSLSRLEARPPSIQENEAVIDSVVRGTFTRQVRAPGTLIPENIRYVAAVTAGRVEARPLRPGATVTKGTVILELSNPEVQLQALEAQRQVTQAEQELVTLRTNLEGNRLTQSALIATLTSQRNAALRDAETQDALEKRGLGSVNEIKRARESATELQVRLDLEQKRLDLMSSAMDEQIGKAKANLDRLVAIARFQEERVNSMKVTAGLDGVLQALTLELGQWVVPGQTLATVAQPGRLKAVLRVPETQAKDVAIGQKTSIDTRNGFVSGRVIRTDPAAINGTVTVDIALDGELPKGARPDLSVDGTIELERLSDVLYVTRPAYGQPESTVGLFKVDPDGNTASRINVKLGRASVTTIEVVSGLQPGDKVIVSDMSRYDTVNKVRLK